IDAVRPAASQQTHQRRGGGPAGFAPEEQPVLPSNRDPPDRPFRRVVVDGQSPVLHKGAELLAVTQNVLLRLPRIGAGRVRLGFHRLEHFRQLRPAFGVPHAGALFGGRVTDALFDRIQGRDLQKHPRLVRRLAFAIVDDFAPRVRPAGLHHPAL
ncbi:hypothetical protein RZS08_16030, partial [Arthrospira platensis SPKY1]|nr:hypothetical protein [Arthrospira platensis SPKY1]